MGVYQRWTTYALKPESVSEMHFHANSKKTQSLGKNGCRQKCLDKSLCIGFKLQVLINALLCIAVKL